MTRLWPSVRAWVTPSSRKASISGHHLSIVPGLLCRQHQHDHHDRGHDLQHHDGRWLTQAGWGTDPH